MSKPLQSSLFRSEVLTARKAQWLGPVLLTPKMSDRLFAGFAAFATVAVFALLIFGTYPRKVRVSGNIVPEGGLVQVYAAQGGVITEVNANEGAHVGKGDRLAIVSTELQSATLGATGEVVARQLQARKESLLEDRRTLERLAEQQKKSLSERLEALGTTEKKVGSEIGVQNARLALAGRTVARQKALMKEQIASGENVQQAEEAALEQTARLRELERSRLGTSRDRLAIQGELDDLPLKLQRDVASVDRNIAMVDEQIAELAAKRELVLPAPIAGTVTAMQAKRGGHPDPKVPLMAIVPDGAKLEAQLYCPSRAVGFLKVGQRVLLRYEAFPYQKFGHYEGKIASVSRSAVSPSELPPGTTGTNEPVYRVTVTLASQSVRAYGQAVALQPGMQLDAEVVLESRRLVEWMAEPLFTVSGSWKR
jgi:membrane fusion protein